MALIAMPCAAGLFVMAEPSSGYLLDVYGRSNSAAATMIAILGLHGRVLESLSFLLLNAIMQAHGDVITRSRPT